MPQFRFCPGLSGLRLSFSSAVGFQIPFEIKSVARMPHVNSFLLRGPSGGFLTACARNKVWWDASWIMR
jgi:hypothetical protein